MSFQAWEHLGAGAPCLVCFEVKFPPPFPAFYWVFMWRIQLLLATLTPRFLLTWSTFSDPAHSSLLAVVFRVTLVSAVRMTLPKLASPRCSLQLAYKGSHPEVEKKELPNSSHTHTTPPKTPHSKPTMNGARDPIMSCRTHVSKWCLSMTPVLDLWALCSP